LEGIDDALGRNSSGDRWGDSIHSLEWGIVYIGVLRWIGSSGKWAEGGKSKDESKGGMTWRDYDGVGYELEEFAKMGSVGGEGTFLRVKHP
jgi:hypothetical protein